VISASGDLSVNSYTRQSSGGSLPKSTSFFSTGGNVTLGNIDASKDSVSITSVLGDVTLGSLLTTGTAGTVTINALNGAVKASTNTASPEISAGGTITITGSTIGNSAFTTAPADRPLDLIAPKIILTSTNTGGEIGFTNNPVVADTVDLTVTAAPSSFNVATTAGATFNVSTGATSLTNLSVTANPLAVGDTGTAQVSTASGGAVYVFDADASGNFAFSAPASTGPNVTFRSITGDITLGPTTNIGSGNLTVTANSGSILGASNVTAANVSLTAQQFSNADSTITVGNVSATGTGGSITLKGNTAVTTGNLSAVGGITIEQASNTFTPDVTVTGTMTTTTAPGTISVKGDVINVTSTVTSAGNVTLDAGGQLTTGGAITGASGSTITLESGGGTPYTFSAISAGDAGTVKITSSSGIRQQFSGTGITAQTVELRADAGEIYRHDSSMTGALGLDILNGTNNFKLTAETNGRLLLNANNRAFDLFDITTSGGPDTGTITVASMGGGQTFAVTDNGSGDFNLALSSPTPLDFSFTANNTGIRSAGTGISTSGGDVTLEAFSATAGINLVTGGIATGGGAVKLEARGTAGVTNGTITTAGGTVDILASGGATTAGRAPGRRAG
jgi:hypothetical protein